MRCVGVLVNSPDYNEVRHLIDNLTDELEYYDIREEDNLETAVLLNGYKVNGKLVGIGGIMKYYGLFPYTFYMIQKQYQGMGIGSLLADDNIAFARKKLPLLTTIVERGNTRAVRIAKRHGFKLAIKRKERLYCFQSFNMFGKLSGFAFQIIARIYIFIKRR
jgi:RimJ/RimL family protein N-acetyltransferase